MSVCEAIGKKYFPEDKYETRFEDYYTTCSIDFADKFLLDTVSEEVGCDDHCTAFYSEPEQAEEYETCLEDCEENVKAAATGSVSVEKDTLEVNSATIPIEPVELMEEEGGEMVFSEKKERELRNKLSRIGCVPEELSWIHPHELRPHVVEWEEEPAIYYIHVKKAEKGKCKLPDLVKLV